MDRQKKIPRTELEKQIKTLSQQLTYWQKKYKKLGNSSGAALHSNKALTSRLHYEQMLSACSQVLLTSLETEEALTETLYELLIATEVSRVCLYQNAANKESDQIYFRRTHQACDIAVVPLDDAAQIFYTDGLSRWERDLSRGRPLYCSVDSAPPEERQFIEDRGITSLLALPLWVNGQWYGFICFEDIEQQQNWNSKEVKLLQTVVDMIGSYIGRIKSERALRESEEKYRTLIEQSNDAIFLIYGGRFELINRRFTELFGYTEADAQAPDFVFTNIVASKNRQVAVKKLTWDRSVAAKHRPPYEFTALDKEGNEIFVELSVSYPTYKRGLATQGIIRDITERKQIEEEKRRAYEKIQEYASQLAKKIKEEQRQREIASLLAEVVASVSLTLSKDELLEHILTRLQKLVPYDTAAVFLAKDDTLVLEAVHGLETDFVDEPVALEQNVLFQEMQASKNYILIDNTQQDHRQHSWPDTDPASSWIGAPLIVAQELLGYLAVDRHLPDIFSSGEAELVQAFAHQVAQTIYNAQLYTELKETQEQLVQRERLAALGQMSATVAHELRNPLMSLRLGVEYLTLEIEADDPRYRGSVLVQSNIDRIVNIVENILFVAGTPRLNLTSGSLHEMVEDELDQWEMRLSQKNISLRSELADDLPPINLDFTQMERVLTNLIGNSVDAMGSGGSLCLALYQEDGKQVITIQDDGPGIPVEDQVKIFEPFYTTKSRGTGLGLAIVKQIVEGHGGKISLRSQPGQGTHIKIVLPQTSAAA